MNKKKIIWIGAGLLVLIVIIFSGGSSQTSSSVPASTNQNLPGSENVTQTPAALAPAASQSLSNDNYYTNVDGNSVHSPAYSNTVPLGATARCRDGTYSFSQHRSGTCSHHGGVAKWL